MDWESEFDPDQGQQEASASPEDEPDIRTLRSMTPITGDATRCKLVFDTGEVIKTAAYVAADQGLYPGIRLEASAWAALQQAAATANARLRAARIVSATAVSDRELRRRLMRKGESEADANAAADWLREIGAVDDAQLAARIVRRAAAKGYGAGRIRQELAAKGIPRALWDEALATLPPPDEGIDRYLAQKLRGAPLPPRLEQQKLIDALRRRGHRWADIQSALRRYEEGEE